MSSVKGNLRAGPPEPASSAPLVRRPRLLRHLTASPPARVVLLLAPAGFSKTTCLGEWASADERPFAWVRAESRHDDPVALARAVVESLQGLGPLAPEVPAALSAPSPDLEGTVGPRLHEALADRDPFVLVVDDLHLVSSPESVAFLRSLIDTLPAGSQLALGSRAEPDLPLGRLRARRQLIELGQRELALNAREASELLENIGLRLTGPQVEVICERTEGWPAATYLAGLSLAAQPDLATAVRAFAGDDRFIVDYLGDEFLASTSEARMRFMTRSAVLDELTGPVCDEVLDRKGSARVLRELSRKNSLVVPLDRNETAYRYHHLFAELLTAELRRREPDLERELHDRASAWYAEHDDPVRATDHAIAAGDPERAGELMWGAFTVLISQGRIATVRGWLDAIGDDRARAYSSLALSKAHCHLTLGEGDIAVQWTENARAAARGEPGGEESIAADLHVLRAILSPEGVAAMDADAARASEILTPEDRWQAPCHFFGGVAAHLAGHPGRAKPMLREAVRRGAVHSPLIQVLALSQLGLIAFDDGRRDEAVRLIEQAHEQIERCGMEAYGSTLGVHAVSAMILAGEGRMERAQENAERALEMLPGMKDFPPWYEAQTRIVLSRALTRFGRGGEARRLLDDAGDFEEMTADAVVLGAWHAEALAALSATPDEGPGGDDRLTKAELRTLQYLPSHLSFREIGEAIHVSPNTVKTQAQAAYRKLGATSRAEAVERAREAGLLSEREFIRSG